MVLLDSKSIGTGLINPVTGSPCAKQNATGRSLLPGQLLAFDLPATLFVRIYDEMQQDLRHEQAS